MLTMVQWHLQISEACCAPPCSFGQGVVAPILYGGCSAPPPVRFLLCHHRAEDVSAPPFGRNPDCGLLGFSPSGYLCSERQRLSAPSHHGGPSLSPMSRSLCGVTCRTFSFAGFRPPCLPVSPLNPGSDVAIPDASPKAKPCTECLEPPHYGSKAFAHDNAGNDECYLLWCAAERFFRSFLLLQTMEFMRLLLHALPCQRKAQRMNGGLKRARHLLRGSPLVLALAIALPIASAAGHGPGAAWAAALNVESDGMPCNIANRLPLPGSAVPMSTTMPRWRHLPHPT